MAKVQDVSFFKGSEQDTERKRRLAAALLEQSRQKEGSEVVSGLVVPQSPLIGLSKALQQGMAGYYEGQADREEKARKDSARQTLADALGAYQRGSDTTPTTLSNGDTIKWNKQSPDALGNMYANILMSNEETAPLGMQAVMSNMQAKQNMANEMEMFRQKMPFELELARQKAALVQGASRGGDTGALLDRLVEVGKQSDPNYNLLNALQDLKGGAGERGKLTAQTDLGRDAEYEKQSGQNISDLKYKPMIERETSAASEVGKREGEAEGSLQFLEANMPKLRAVTNKLSRLGATATYTKSGQAEDFIQRELGLDPGQDAQDRADYIATVDNEVLPLLRETFGAAFTVAEGNSLRATLGDVNKHPREKDAILNAFIQQKEEQVKSLKRQVGQQAPHQTPGALDPSLLEHMTPEERALFGQ